MSNSAKDLISAVNARVMELLELPSETREAQFEWLTNYFCYCASETLANPQFETNGPRQVILSGGGNPIDYRTYGGRYVSVFDPASNDINFQNIMGNTAVCWVTLGYTTYRKQTISITL